MPLISARVPDAWGVRHGGACGTTTRAIRTGHGGVGVGRAGGGVEVVRRVVLRPPVDGLVLRVQGAAPQQQAAVAGRRRHVVVRGRRVVLGRVPVRRVPVPVTHTHVTLTYILTSQSILHSIVVSTHNFIHHQFSTSDFS